MRRFGVIGRVVLDVAAVAGVLLPLPALSMVAIPLLLILFGAWEAVLVAFLMDIVWLPAVSSQHFPLFTIGTLILALIVHPLRKKFFLP